MSNNPQDGFEFVEKHEPLFYDSSRATFLPTPTVLHHKAHKARHLRHIAAFFLGVLCCLLTVFHVYPLRNSCSISSNLSSSFNKEFDGGASATDLSASPWAGSTVMHKFPPTKPTNAYPTLFPSNIGFAGPARTGDEAAIVATAPAYPLRDSICGVLVGPTDDLPYVPDLPGVPGAASNEAESDMKDPSVQPNGNHSDFNIFRSWGNLTPWYSIPRGGFGVDATPDPPSTCRVTGLHLLHRHGARYPTAGGHGPSSFAAKLNENTQGWNATGNMAFLNECILNTTLVLTTFGRKQLYDLGATMRMKYGDLLTNFTDANKIPVFRTESQDRMLSSAMNFALGFFGWPLEGKYQQSITIEEYGFNNTLASFNTCPNFINAYGRGDWYVNRWTYIYLQDAWQRLSRDIPGLRLDIGDLYNMQSLCAYETVALGYSKFCELFTEDEWEGFEYANDLTFWYTFGYGSPVARALGIGYVQELVARLTHTPIQTHNSSTNSTLNDNPITFPLDQSIYVDATHDALIMNVLAALNVTTFAKSGPLPYTHIPKDPSFRLSRICPFAANLQFQLLDCDSKSYHGRQIRLVLNDGVVPLTGVGKCPDEKHGLCPLDDFISAQKDIIQHADWDWGCNGNWSVPEGPEWETVTGDPPSKPSVFEL